MPDNLTVSSVIDGLMQATTEAGARSAIGAGTSNFDGVYSSLSGKPDLSVAAITSGTINGTPIGASNPSTGAFTDLSVSGPSTDTVPPFTGPGIMRVIGTATNALIVGTLQLYPFSVYIQAGGSGVYPLSLNPLGGAIIIGGDTFIQSGGANTLALRNSAAEQTLMVGPSSTGMRSNAGELEAFDNAGNVTVISPHAQDAPEWLYEVGPGSDSIERKANIFRAVVTFWNVDREKHLHALNLVSQGLGAAGTEEESSAAWAEVLARRASNRLLCHAEETFAAYETRTGKSLVPSDQDHDWWMTHTPAERWGKVESDRVAKSVADRAAWQARKDAADAALTAWSALPEEDRPSRPAAFTEQEPALYVAQDAPAWCAA